MPKYKIEFFLDKRIIASLEVTAKNIEEAESKAAKTIKTTTKEI